MDNIQLIPFFFQSYPESFVIIVFGLTITGARFTIRKIAISALIATLFSFFVRSFPTIFGIHALIQLLILVFLVKVFMKLPFYWSTIAVLSGSLTVGILESLLLPLFLNITGIALPVLLQNLWLRAIYPAPYTIGLAGLTYYLYKEGRVWLPVNKFHHNVEQYFPKTTSFFLIIGFIQAFLLILLNTAYYAYRSEQFLSISLNSLFVITTVTLFITTITTVVMSYYMLRVSQNEAELRAQHRHFDSMQTLYLAVRSQRHDFINHVMSLYGMLMAEDTEEAKNYMKDLYREIRLNQTMLNIGIPSLSGLLQTKSTVAEERGVSFELCADVSFAAIPVSPAELTAIVGNLIDNAFDATKESGVVNPSIRVELLHERDSFYISVKNTGKPLEHNDVKKLLSAGFTTKDKSVHSGLGLYTVHSIVKKHTGLISVENPEDRTGVAFTITIPDKEAGRGNHEDSNR